MKRFLLSVCIPALTFFGFALKAHAAEPHSAAAFMNAEGEVLHEQRLFIEFLQPGNGLGNLVALGTKSVE